MQKQNAKLLYTALALIVGFLFYIALPGCKSALSKMDWTTFKSSKDWISEDKFVTYKLGFIGIDSTPSNILITLPFNGEDRMFVIDTGSASSWFTQKFVEDHNFKVFKKEYSGTGLGGARSRFDVVLIDKAQIGFAKMTNWIVISGKLPSVEDDADLPAKKGYPPVVGLLGSDFLFRFGASIDYRKMEITFTKPDM